MLRILIFIVFSINSSERLNVKSEEKIISGVVISINNELITYQGVQLFKFKNDIIIDTLIGVYVPGKFTFNAIEFEKFNSLNCDSIIMDIDVPNNYTMDGKIIYGELFRFKYDYRLFKSEYQIILIESLSLKENRVKWKLHCRDGFILFIKTDGVGFPIFNYTKCNN
jgi:hypothetical protein